MKLELPYEAHGEEISYIIDEARREAEVFLSGEKIGKIRFDEAGRNFEAELPRGRVVRHLHTLQATLHGCRGLAECLDWFCLQIWAAHREGRLER